MSAPVEKVALEAAEAEFVRWSEAMDVAVKLDTSTMDDDDRKSFEQQKRPIIDAIRFGRLVVDDQGQFVFTPQLGDDRSPLTFPEPDGAALLSIDKAGKATDLVHKQYTLLAAITGQYVQRFSKMKNRDLVVCNAILGFLLAR